MKYNENTGTEKELNKRGKDELFFYWTELLNVSDATREQHAAAIASYQKQIKIKKY